MWTRQHMWTVEEAVHADETLQVNEAVHVGDGAHLDEAVHVDEDEAVWKKSGLSRPFGQYMIRSCLALMNLRLQLLKCPFVLSGTSRVVGSTNDGWPTRLQPRQTLLLFVFNLHLHVSFKRVDEG